MLKSFNPFIQVFYFYSEHWSLWFCRRNYWVLIPLFRSFIFTLVHRGEFEMFLRDCFNPFIQVFYFYWIYTKQNRLKSAFRVLIPLFRSFIFTRNCHSWTLFQGFKVLIPLFRSFIFTEVYADKWSHQAGFHSFNPFIQVFYFYMTFYQEITEKSYAEVLIPLFRSFIFTG